jgi:hypothetical protein
MFWDASGRFEASCRVSNWSAPRAFDCAHAMCGGAAAAHRPASDWLVLVPTQVMSALSRGTRIFDARRVTQQLRCYDRSGIGGEGTRGLLCSAAVDLSSASLRMGSALLAGQQCSDVGLCDPLPKAARGPSLALYEQVVDFG